MVCRLVLVLTSVIYHKKSIPVLQKNNRRRETKKNIIISIILTAVVCSIMLVMFLLTTYVNGEKTGSANMHSRTVKKQQTALADKAETPGVHDNISFGLLQFLP